MSIPIESRSWIITNFPCIEPGSASTRPTFGTAVEACSVYEAKVKHFGVELGFTNKNLGTQWRLICLHLSPPRRNRPPSLFLRDDDPRSSRPVSPFWCVDFPDGSLSPLATSPSASPPAAPVYGLKTERATQTDAQYTTRSCQTSAEWVSPDRRSTRENRSPRRKRQRGRAIFLDSSNTDPA